MQLQLGRIRIRVTATNMLVAVATLVSLAITLVQMEADATLGAGFLPARVGGADLPADWWSVPVWLTPISATMVHIGIAHLAINMVLLLLTGRVVERLLGPAFTLALYGIGAYVAAAAQWGYAQWLPNGDPASVMVGASGAISTIVGAWAMLNLRSRKPASRPGPASYVDVAWLILLWALLNLGLSLTIPAGLFAWAAHVAGFAFGVALARPLLRLRYRKGLRAA